MRRVRVTQEFIDLAAGDRRRKIGEEYDATAKRVGFLEDKGLVAILPAPNESDPPPDPHTPAGVVAMNAADAIHRIAKIETVEFSMDGDMFLEHIRGLEEQREKPRSTVLEAVEARLAELGALAYTDSTDADGEPDGPDASEG